MSSANRAHKLMSAFECNRALLMQYELSKKLREGSVKYNQEAALQVDNSHLQVRFVFENGTVHEPQSIHQVLCIENFAGEAFVIDVTGAQHGQKKAVMPLQSALVFYGSKVNVVFPHDHYRADMPQQIKEQLAGGTGWSPRDNVIPKFLGLLFDKQFAAWEKQKGDLASSYLNATHKVFDEFKKTVHTLVVAASVEVRQALKKTPPIDLVDALEISAECEMKVSKQVNSIITKHYFGSKIGKTLGDWILEQTRRSQPEKFERVLEPFLAQGGNLKPTLDRDCKKRGTLAKSGKEDDIRATIVNRDKGGSYWAKRTLEDCEREKRRQA